MIHIITFDLDDTLWDVSPVVEQANKALYRWLNTHAPAFTARYQIADFSLLRQEVVEQQPHIAHSVTAIRLAVLRLGLSTCSYQGEELERLISDGFRCFLTARNQVQFFRHALQMIQELHGQYRLGALSNGNADLARVGLDDYFDFSFNADQVGSAKPEPLMFQRMLEHTGAQPGQVLHIGDHPVHDIQGAQQVGLHTLWVNLNKESWPDAPPPTREVHCLSEIPAAVASLNKQLG